MWFALEFGAKRNGGLVTWAETVSSTGFLVASLIMLITMFPAFLVVMYWEVNTSSFVDEKKGAPE
jgi:hypothetical protein